MMSKFWIHGATFWVLALSFLPNVHAQNMTKSRSVCKQTGTQFSTNMLYLEPGKSYRLFTTKGEAACKTFEDLKRNGFTPEVRTCRRLRTERVEVLLTPAATCYKDYSHSAPYYYCEMALSLQDGNAYGTVANPCGAESIVGVRN